MQYHPELSLTAIAEALDWQGEALIEQGLLRTQSDLDRYDTALKTLEVDPERRDLRWQLGLDDEVIALSKRRREIANFLKGIEVI